MNNDLIDRYKAVRKLISLPERWTQGEYAKDVQGYPVKPKTMEAVCFCTLGALERVAHDRVERRQMQKYLTRIATEETGLDLVELNDTSTHEEIIAFFDRAISKLETENNS